MRWRMLALAVSICVFFPRAALCDAGAESGFEAAFAEYSDTMSHEGYYRPGDERRSAVHGLIDKAPDGSVVTVAPGEYVSNYFALTGRHNLTIRAKPGTAWLVSDDPLASILSIHNCTGITFEGIGFLHRTSGHCTGSSISVVKSRTITFESCDISGSGVIGVGAGGVDNLTISNCYIHHCTYEIISLACVRDVRIRNCLFSHNREATTLAEGLAVGATWGRCIVENNTFAHNACAAIVFNLPRNRAGTGPKGTGRIEILRNVFIDNRSPAKVYSIWDAATDEREAKYLWPAAEYVTFKQNLLDDARQVDGSIPAGENHTKPGIDSRAEATIDGIRIGCDQAALSWIADTRIPDDVQSEHGHDDGGEGLAIFSESTDDPMADIRTWFSEVNVAAADTTMYGGPCHSAYITLTFHAVDGRLVKVVEGFGHDHGWIATDYYFRNGELFFVYNRNLAGDWAPPDQPRLYDEYRYYYHQEEPIRCLHKHFEGNYEGGGEKTVAGMPNEELDCADSEATGKLEEARAFLKAFRAGTVSEDYLECR